MEHVDVQRSLGEMQSEITNLRRDVDRLDSDFKQVLLVEIKDIREAQHNMLRRIDSLIIVMAIVAMLSLGKMAIPFIERLISA